MFYNGDHISLAFSLLILPGVIISTNTAGSWNVSSPSRLCALTGSSVTIFCTYRYPQEHTVTDVSWYSNKDKRLTESELFKNRGQFLGDKKNNCSLRINGLRESDSKEKYKFWFRTNSSEFSGAGVTLSVTALRVMMSPKTVTEGRSVTLTCSTTCSLGNSTTYIWYKNGLPVSTTHTPDNTFSINKVRVTDEGRYSCAVTGHDDHPSDFVTLSVRYAPRNTTALLSLYMNEGTSVAVICSKDAPALLSLSIKEHTSVTLTCSSDAKPSVRHYSWYKKIGAKSSLMVFGQNYSITDAKVADSGQYYCKAENIVGATESSTLPLNVYKVTAGLRSAVLVPAIIVVAIAVSFVCWWRRTAERAFGVHSQGPDATSLWHMHS
ncbi:B-cell receptor CD22-like isoform X1 [Alosa pseudoharengus]|uniref:B-cell receptor CD22-like isoform X1 n=1 Tax=Alosa pseudoharengus TaxID=34774 RepID=UPI003F8AE290